MYMFSGLQYFLIYGVVKKLLLQPLTPLFNMSIKRSKNFETSFIQCSDFRVYKNLLLNTNVS